MEKVHSDRYSCWAGRHSFNPMRTTEDSDVSCKNCLKSMAKTKNRRDKIERWVVEHTSSMSNEVLLDEVLSLEHNGEWYDDEDIFERNIFIRVLKERIGDWVNE